MRNLPATVVREASFSSSTPEIRRGVSPLSQDKSLDQLHDRELLLEVARQQGAIQGVLQEVSLRIGNVEKLLADGVSASPIPSLFLSEKDAASIEGISPKTLADRRRAGRVPRDLYRQDSPSGKVKYDTRRWRRHLGLEENGG